MKLDEAIQVMAETPNEVLKQCLHEVIGGTGYAKPDGGEKTCGQIDGNGVQCYLYRAKQRKCVILGPDFDITPSMTCTQQRSGPEVNVKPMVLATPASVGLTETKEGATCKRCDRRNETGKQMTCYWLSSLLKQLLTKAGYDSAGVNFAIEPDACCDFWKRDGVEEVL